jgi:hypothetical protein
MSDERVSYRKKMKMANRHPIIIVFILMIGIVAACESTPTPTSLPAAVPATLGGTESVPTNPPPTVVPTATATNSPPTSVPTTEDIETDADQDNPDAMEANRMIIEIGDHVLTATLVDNSSVEALKEALSEGPITINMRDYGSMEKVGPLGRELPRNDEQITTEAGDIILFQGNLLVIYYAPNSWNFTRLGKINDVTAEELREIFGDGNVTLTLSLPHE